MRIAEGTRNSGWISFATSYSLTLSSGDGGKQVNVNFKDWSGWSSTLYTATLKLDATPPSSAVLSLPKIVKATPIEVRWNGDDPTFGTAGLFYTVQYRIGTMGAWITWPQDTPLTSALFSESLIDGDMIYFRVQAKDQAGNVEEWPAGDGDAFTTYVQPPVTNIFLPLIKR
jgi:hypothetical protein